ncbi:hypothetical protein GCM10023259_101160 [Thermocatellispora tengchongensis]
MHSGAVNAAAANAKAIRVIFTRRTVGAADARAAGAARALTIFGSVAGARLTGGLPEIDQGAQAGATAQVTSSS